MQRIRVVKTEFKRQQPCLSPEEWSSTTPRTQAACPGRGPWPELRVADPVSAASPAGPGPADRRFRRAGPRPHDASAQRVRAARSCACASGPARGQPRSHPRRHARTRAVQLQNVVGQGNTIQTMVQRLFDTAQRSSMTGDCVLHMYDDMRQSVSVGHGTLCHARNIVAMRNSPLLSRCT